MRSISKRDLEFLATYANTYYPLREDIRDIKGVILQVEGYDKAQKVLIKEKESMEKKLAKAEERRKKLEDKFGYDFVLDTINQYDGYSN